MLSSQGTLEPAGVLRTGTRRRATLAANSALSDLYALGGDRLLRMFNPKGTTSQSLRCVQLLRPQLLDGAFLRANPGFSSRPPHEQRALVDDHYGAGRSLDVPHEVVDLRLHEGAGLVALVGVHRVSVLSLPPSASLSAPTTDAADELGAMLGQLGLTEYAAPLRGLGYDHVHSLLRMNAAERQAMAKQVGMKPGHAQTLTMHLDGRLPAAPPPPPSAAASSTATVSATEEAGEATRCYAAALTWVRAGPPAAALLQNNVNDLEAPMTSIPATIATGLRSLDISSPLATGIDSPLRIGPSPRIAAGGATSAFASPRSAFQRRTSTGGGTGTRIGLSPGDTLIGGVGGGTGTGTGGGSGSSSGASVVQVAWHPLGESHLGVLLSDGSFHLFDAARSPEQPILTLDVPAGSVVTPRDPPPTRSRPASGGAALPMASGADTGGGPVGFSFGGPTQPGWASLTAYFATSSGDVYAACPIVPSGQKARRHVLALAPSLEIALDEAEEVEDGAGSVTEEARAWLDQFTSGDEVPSAPPRVQGPLSIESDAITGSRVLSLCCLPLPGGLTGLLLGLDDHTILVSMLTGVPLPIWGDDGNTANDIIGDENNPHTAFAPTTGAVSMSIGSPSAASNGPPTSPPFRAPRTSIGASTLAPGSGPFSAQSGGGARGHALNTVGRFPWRGSISGNRSYSQYRASISPIKGLTPLPKPSAHPSTPLVEHPDVHTNGAGSVGELEGGASLMLLSRAKLGEDSETSSSVEKPSLRWMELTADRVAPGRIFIHSSAGALHLLELPWLYDWALYLTAANESSTHAGALTTNAPPVPPLECIAQALLASSAPIPPAGSVPFPAASPSHATHPDARFRRGAGVVGVAALRDPALGDALFAMTNDGKCTRVQLELVPRPASAAANAPSADAAGKDSKAGEALERDYNRALSQLSHQQGAGKAATDSADEIGWARCKSELSEATGEEVLPAFERALTSLAGAKSRLREWGGLAEESATRLERIDKQSSEQPSSEKKLVQEVSGVEAELDVLMHKARLAAALQDNLESRAKALRAVLRQPSLWPCGELSVEEEAQHNELLAMRDRVLEGQRRMHDLLAMSEANGAKASATADAPLEEETAELMQQDALLHRLTLALKRAKQQGEEALALAQSVAVQ